MSKWLFLYPLVLFLYSIYSYSQVAPNLVLSSNSYYWQFQQWMWQLGYHSRPLSTLLFGLLMAGSFACYGLLLYSVKNKLINFKQVVFLFVLCVIALLPSYPALSNDIFNYLMNAKMMHVYKASPYEHAAWDFPDEPWLNFMMNIHTVTPYGYVWTGIGYLTYLAGFGDLQFGMITFRLLALIFMIVIGWGIWTVRRKEKLEMLVYFIFNPLVLYEAFNNTHNDITMMGLFVAGIAIWQLLQNQKKILSYAALTGFWLMSVFTKLITVIAPAVVAFYVVARKWIPQFNWADWLTFAFIVVMYADGSKRFFTWYLLWAACVVPLAQSRYSKQLMIAFSISGMLSYTFFLYSGEYNAYWGTLRISLLFLIPAIYSLYYGLARKHA